MRAQLRPPQVSAVALGRGASGTGLGRAGAGQPSRHAGGRRAGPPGTRASALPREREGWGGTSGSPGRRCDPRGSRRSGRRPASGRRRRAPVRQSRGGAAGQRDPWPRGGIPAPRPCLIASGSPGPGLDPEPWNVATLCRRGNGGLGATSCHVIELGGGGPGSVGGQRPGGGVAERWAHSYPPPGKAFQKGFKFKKQRSEGVSHLLRTVVKKKGVMRGIPVPTWDQASW